MQNASHTSRDRVREYLERLSRMNLSAEEENAIIGATGFRDILDIPDPHLTFAIVIPVVLVVGTVGNVLNLIVLRSKRVRFSNGLHIFLSAMAVADIVVLWSHAPAIFVDLFCGNLPLANITLIRFLMAMELFKLSSRFTSTWMMVAVSVTRCLALTYPAQANRLVTHRRIRCVLVAIVIAGIATATPEVAGTSFTVRKMYGKIDVVVVASTSFGRSYYAAVIHPIMTSVFVFVIPFVFLLLTNTSMVISVWKASRRRRVLACTHTKTSKNETKVTILLLTITVSFFLLELPGCVFEMFHAVHGTNGRMFLKADMTIIDMLDWDAFQDYAHVKYVIDCFYIIAVSINFILFCLVSTRFRRVFKEMFFGRWLDISESSVNRNVAKKSEDDAICSSRSDAYRETSRTITVRL
ncbi:PREDICTED: sex peptide receptor-like [Priapulus caudatus]|uniref:Sex peptide receptor-like n=1 Tax=Priapulus caudatus TaxID=37621 RepID=A0ABM1EE16_PRICU|nr:PREDICTED: sex peptide receptor-like [Priapulus caudatus]